MNSKDVAHFRKHVKPGHDLLKIFHIFNVYVTKDSSEIYHHECHPFELLEPEQQELFVGNFKKLLSGQFGEKLFELDFQDEAEDHTRSILHSALQSHYVEDWKEWMLRLVDKMLKDVRYDHDLVITFIRGEYFKPTKKRNEEAEESERDEVYAFPYMLCTINKTEQPQKTLVFDYISKEFRSNVAVDPIVKLTAPAAGFLYPCFTDNTADVNHVLYAAGKANEPDIRFIEDVLNGRKQATAQEDKTVFEEIIREVAGEQLDTATLAHVYEEINSFIEEHADEDAPKLDYKDVERVLTASGVEDVRTEKVEQAFRQVTDNVKYELKAESVIPKYTSKSIKINTKIANITISPQDLQYVRQVNYQGKRCLLIEIDDSNPDRYVMIPLDGLTPRPDGDDIDVQTTMTAQDLAALPDATLEANTAPTPPA